MSSAAVVIGVLKVKLCILKIFLILILTKCISSLQIKCVTIPMKGFPMTLLYVSFCFSDIIFIFLLS